MVGPLSVLPAPGAVVADIPEWWFPRMGRLTLRVS